MGCSCLRPECFWRRRSTCLFTTSSSTSWSRSDTAWRQWLILRLKTMQSTRVSFTCHTINQLPVCLLCFFMDITYDFFSVVKSFRLMRLFLILVLFLNTFVSACCFNLTWSAVMDATTVWQSAELCLILCLCLCLFITYLLIFNTHGSKDSIIIYLFHNFFSVLFQFLLF